MIKNICFSLIFFCLILALSIKVVNPSIVNVELGPSFMAFMKNCNLQLNDFKIEIPSIPSIPYFNSGSNWVLVLNFLINVVNGLSSLINFVITIVNVVLQLLQFIFIVISNVINLRDDLMLNA